MSTNEIARRFRARKAGRYKGRQAWQAKCPCHQDRSASLSITEPAPGRTRVNCFAGCDNRAILATAGLSVTDLYADKKSKTPERIRDEEAKADLEVQLGLVILLQSEKGKRNYWAAAERRIRKELDLIRCRLEPERVYREYHPRPLRRGSVRGFESILERWTIK